MIEAIRKVLLAGVGAAAFSVEKAEKALGELVEKGKLSADDAKEAARKLADEGKREFEEASRTLETKLDATLAKLGRGQGARIEALETQVAALSARVSELEGAAAAKAVATEG